MWISARGGTSRPCDRARPRTVERDVAPVSEADLDFAQIWQSTISTLDADGLSARERAFLTLGRLAGLLDGTALVKVPNDYTKDVVETRLRDALTEALSRQLGDQVHLAVTVDTSLEDSPVEDTVGLPDERRRLRRLDPGHLRRPVALERPQRPLRPGHRRHPARPSPCADRGTTPPPRARRPPGSTRSTPSTPSSSAPATASPTRPPSRWPRRRPRRTTRSSSTASPGWARPTCCTRSATTPATSTPTSRCAT